MSTYYELGKRKSPVIKPGILLLMILAALVFVTYIPMPQPYTAGIQYITGPGLPNIKTNPDQHPYKGHSADDVARVRACIQKNGAVRQYRQDLGGGRFRLHLLCRDVNGEWLDMVIEKLDGIYTEITSFPTGWKDWTTVERWLARKPAVPFKKFP